MPYIAGYLLKLSVSLSVVYLFYVLVLRRLTFYSWNRWYLMGYSLLAFFIPFINISPVLQQSDWDKHAMLQFIPVFGKLEIGNSPAAGERFVGWSLLLMGMAIGIVLMLVRFAVRYISYYRIRRTAQLLVDEGVKIYHVDKSIIPFSFGNAIFINRQLHGEEELQQIIHHEFIHVKQRHTIDILWSELLCMLNWYNPFAWLIRKSIRQNLEFIADNKVLQNGIDKKDYQYLLLKVTGAAHFSITQQFNFTSLKKRIIMMNRSRSARIQLTRFLFILPVLTVLLLAFRTNVLEEKRHKAEQWMVQLKLKEMVFNKIDQIRDTIPAQLGKSLKDFYTRNPSVKNIAWIVKENTNKSPYALAVYRHDGTMEEYDWTSKQAKELFKERYGVAPDSPQIAVTEKNTNHKQLSDTVMVDASLDGPGNPYWVSKLPNVLLVIDGILKENAGEALRDLKPESIESMNVLKIKEALKAYGDKAKNKEGVIEINTKKQSYSIADTVLIRARDTVLTKEIPHLSLRIGRPNPAPLYIVDGVEMPVSEFSDMKVDPDRIESITVLKDAASIKLYGSKGKDGVIIIKLKKPITGTNFPLSATEVLTSLVRDTVQSKGTLPLKH